LQELTPNQKAKLRKHFSKIKNLRGGSQETLLKGLLKVFQILKALNSNQAFKLTVMAATLADGQLMHGRVITQETLKIFEIAAKRDFKGQKFLDGLIQRDALLNELETGLGITIQNLKPNDGILKLIDVILFANTPELRKALDAAGIRVLLLMWFVAHTPSLITSIIIHKFGGLFGLVFLLFKRRFINMHDLLEFLAILIAIVTACANASTVLYPMDFNSRKVLSPKELPAMNQPGPGFEFHHGPKTGRKFGFDEVRFTSDATPKPRFNFMEEESKDSESLTNYLEWLFGESEDITETDKDLAKKSSEQIRRILELDTQNRNIVESTEYSTGRSRYILTPSALFSIEVDSTPHSLVENQKYFKYFIGDLETKEITWDIESQGQFENIAKNDEGKKLGQ